LQPLTAKTFDEVFAIDARASALLIAEFAHRHRQRGARSGRIICLTSEEQAGSLRRCPTGQRKLRWTVTRWRRPRSWPNWGSPLIVCIPRLPTPAG
jgi:hypothetical protein